MPEIQITLPTATARRNARVSVSSMGKVELALIGGTIFTSSTQYPKDGHRYDIRVRSEDAEHKDVTDLNSILMHNNYGGTHGELVPLGKDGP